MSAQRFCTACGKPLQPGHRFCADCGAATTDVTANVAKLAPAETAPEGPEPAPIPLATAVGEGPSTGRQEAPSRQFLWLFGLFAVAIMGALGGAALALRGPSVEPAIALPRSGSGVALANNPSLATATTGVQPATATPTTSSSPTLAVQGGPSVAPTPTVAAPTSAPPASNPASAATSTATPRPPSATVPPAPTATATATKPPPTATAQASARISGYFRVGQAGGLCGGCLVRFIGPITFNVTAANDGRYSAGTGFAIPVGTYKVYYECRGSYIAVNQPQTVVLAPGNNTFDVVIGFCG